MSSPLAKLVCTLNSAFITPALHAGACPAPARSRAPTMPLDSVANGDTSSLRAPPPRVPGPDKDALAILTGQIHALLERVRPDAGPAFVKALDALGLDETQALTRKQADRLLSAFKLLPTIKPRSDGACKTGRQELLRNALHDLTRAARAEAMLHEQIARHADRQRRNALPGSERSVTISGTVGARFGAPVGGPNVGVKAGGSRTRSDAVYDDMTVARGRTSTVQAAGYVGGMVAPGLGLQGTLSGYSSAADLDISLSMQAHVVRLGHASVERRLGGNAVQRALKRITCARRDRYGERTSRALAWQSRLPMLLGRQAVTQPLAFSTRGVLIRAALTTHGGALGVSAEYGPGHLGGTGSMSRTELCAALPVRVTEPGKDGRPAGSDAAIQFGLEARVAQLVARHDVPLPPALQRVRQLLKHPLQPHHLGMRLAAVADVHAAFDHLQALGELQLRASGQAVLPLASLLRDWGVESGGHTDAMINMLDTLAWLQATPEPPPGPALVEWTHLQRAVQLEARRVHETPLPHDRQRVHHATHAFREQIQRIASTGFTVSMSGTLPAGGVSAEFGVARQVRQDPDPLRDGTYYVLTFAAGLGVSIGPILSEVERRVPEWGALPLQEVERLVEPLALAADATGTGKVEVRFFRPSFQDAPGFPASARGIRLYTVRAMRGTSLKCGLEAPIPVLTAFSPTLGAQYARNDHSTFAERIGANTLTGLLLRYRSLCSETMSAAEAWVALQASHGNDLDRLIDTLADATSPPAVEARFWLEQKTTTLDAFDRTADHAMRRAQLLALFDAVGEATSRKKAMSPLLGAPTLSAAD